MSILLKAIAILTVISIATSAQAQTKFSSTSTSSTSNYQTDINGNATFEFENTPLADVLSTFGVTSQVKFDETASDALESTVSYCGKDMKVEKAITALLAAAKLRVVATKAGNVVTATEEGDEITTAVRTLDAMFADKVLDRPVTLTMRYTPLDMVVRFAAGMSGVDIQIDTVALQRAGINSRVPVSINTRNEALGDAMNKMLKPHGLVLEVINGMVVVTTIKTETK